MKRSLIVKVTACLLSMAFACAAVAKISGGYDRSLGTSVVVYYCAAGVEFLVACLLVSPCRLYGAMGACAFACASVSWQILLRSGECPCLGQVFRISKATAIVIAATMGCVGGLLLLEESARRRSRVRSGAR
jgi:hypothetical protein